MHLPALSLSRRGLLAVATLATNTRVNAMVLDSHVHVWDSSSPYAPGQTPPPELGDAVASEDALVASMGRHRIDGALIVQPINYQFDHSHVAAAIKRFPTRLRGMALADPSDAGTAAQKLREACRTAPGLWTGVRFNPYLWPEASQGGDWLADAAGLALLEVCHELSLPIGVMAFQGLTPLLPSIEKLLAHPKAVPVVIDHWGFPRESPGAAISQSLAWDDAAWDSLLALARRQPGLHLKISALFRVAREPSYRDLQPKFDAAVDAFGAERLLWGSDFPYAQLNGGQGASLEAARVLAKRLSGKQRDMLLGGTAATLFGFDAEMCRLGLRG